MAGVKSPMPGIHYLPAAVIDHYVAEGVLRGQTLGDAISEAATRWPDRIAVSEPGAALTHREFDEITDRVAAALHDLGLVPLDRVIFQAVNSKELLYAFFGCIKAGLIPVCTLAAHRAHEIQQIGGQAAARAHIVSYSPDGFDLVEFAIGMGAKLPAVEHVIAIQCGTEAPHGARALDALWQAQDPARAKAVVAKIREELDPCQAAIFQLSGGTSGTPKIIPRFHNEYAYAARSIVNYFGFDEKVVSFTPNPHMHNMPMVCFVLPALLAGGEVAVAPSAKIEVIATVIRERKPTWCAIFPVHIMRMLEMRLLDADSFAGAYGLVCMNNAAKFSATVNAPAFTLYGMTEGLLCHSRAEDPKDAIDTTIGRSITEYDEIRLVHPGTERDVEPGEIGELIVRGPSVTRGYYDAPERNADAFTSDCFYRSGDLMRWRVIEGRRYLAFEGRVKDVIDRGGEKINCSEVEEAIAAHPAVGAVLCVGMPDRTYGERMCAFVIPAAGSDEAKLDLGEIARHLRVLGLAKFKYPERVEVIDAFPHTSSGKPSKPLLRDLITDKLAREGAGPVAAA